MLKRLLATLTILALLLGSLTVFANTSTPPLGDIPQTADGSPDHGGRPWWEVNPTPAPRPTPRPGTGATPTPTPTPTPSPVEFLIPDGIESAEFTGVRIIEVPTSNGGFALRVVATTDMSHTRFSGATGSDGHIVNLGAGRLNVNTVPLISGMPSSPTNLARQWYSDNDMIVSLRLDDTLTVRTDTNETVRIYLGEESTQATFRRSGYSGFGIAIDTSVWSPHNDNFIDGNISTHPRSHRLRRNSIQVPVWSPGAIVRVQEVTNTFDAHSAMTNPNNADNINAAMNATVVRDIGTFMIGDFGSIQLIDMPDGLYRITLLQAPLGFTTRVQDYGTSHMRLDTSGRNIAFIEVSQETPFSTVEFILLPEDSFGYAN